MKVPGPQFSLRAKLYFSFVCVVTALCVGVASTRYLSSQLAENLENITGNVIPLIRSLNGINAAALNIAEATNTLWYASQRSDEDQEKILNRERAELFGARDQLRDVEKKYFALAASRPTQRQYSGELRQLLRQLENASDQIVAILDRKAPAEEGEKDIEIMEEVVPKIPLLTGLAVDLETSSLHERKQKAEGTINEVVRLVAAVLLLSIGIVGAVGVGLYGSLLDSIVRLRSAVEAVGAGALGTRIKRVSNDEIGSVTKAFNRMVSSLEASTISRSFLESVLASLLDSVIVVDEKGCVVSVNDAFVRISGFSPEESISKPVENFLIGYSFSDICSSPPSISGTSPTFLLSQNGERIAIALACAPLKETAESGTKWVVVARDVRAQLKADAEVRAYREQLDRAQQLAALGSVSALLAHKVNQPLTVIQLLLQQSLRELNHPDIVSAKITESLSEARQVSSTLKEVLRFTRPADLKTESDVSLWAIAEKLSGVFQGAARDAAITLNFTALVDFPLVRGIAAELEEIFFILIENAIQAAPRLRQSELNVTAERNEKAVLLRFADTCTGIAEENLERIFDLFFTTKPRNQGTGLGLGILKQLISMRGGDISVESRIDEGTCFTIRLPMRLTAVG